jgi:[ribosomal protein S5]-alanine N-acetyltransferase
MSFRLEPILLTVDPRHPDFQSDDCQSLLKVYPEYYNVIGFNPPWIGYFVYRDNRVVGCCGYTGKPVNGRVEIAYGTFKEFENQGVSTFSCQSLTALAIETDGEVTVTAKTAPEVNNSVRILKKNGFHYTGIVQDNEIGDAWEWVFLKES